MFKMSQHGAVAVAVLLFCFAFVTVAASESAKGEGGKKGTGMYLDKDLVTLYSDLSCDRSSDPVALLSVDGGGLRGISIVEILVEVENAIKKTIVDHLKPGMYQPEEDYKSPNEFEIDLGDYFKAMAGVDSGAWIVTYLASRGGDGASERVFNNKLVIEKYGFIRSGSVQGLRVFFLHYASRIYPPYSVAWTILPRRYGFSFKRAGFNAPRYPVRGLEATLDLFLGQSYYSSTHNTTVFVHVYDLLRKSAVLFMRDTFSDPGVYTYIFQNEEAPRVQKVFKPSSQVVKGKQYFMKDIARASSASPTIFEAKRFAALDDESFEFYAIDGNMMTNNPTLMATYFLTMPGRAVTEKGEPVNVLSIGAGIPTGSYRKHSESGAFQWLIQTNDFLAIVMDGGSEFLQTQFYTLYYKNLRRDSGTKEIKENHYLRIQTAYDRRTPQGDALSDMYSADNVLNLQLIGKETALRFSEQIAFHVKKYVAPQCFPNFAELIRRAQRQKVKLEYEEKTTEVEKKRSAGKVYIFPEEAPAPSPEESPEWSPAEVKPSPLEVQPPLTEVQPPPLEVQPPPAEVQPPPLEVQPPPLEVQPPPLTKVQPPPLEVQPPPAEVVPTKEESPPTEVKPPPTSSRMKPVLINSGTVSLAESAGSNFLRIE